MPRLSAKEAISFIPMLKNTGITLKDNVDFVAGVSGSSEYTASGIGRITVKDERDPTTRGSGNCIL